MLPTWRWTWELIEAAVGQRTGGDGVQDASVAAGLAQVEVAFLAGIPPETLVRVHQEEDAFVAWRAQLRLANRLIGYAPSDAEFSNHAAEVIRDVLIVPTALDIPPGGSYGAVSPYPLAV